MDSANSPRFEAMTLGALLDRAFRLYSSNFPLMLGIVATAYVPLYAVQLLIQASVGRGVALSGRDFTAVLAEILFVLLWASVALPIATGAATYAISERYLNHDVTVGQALKRAWKRLWTLCIAQLAVAVRVLIGFLLLIIPGILWSLSYAIVTPVVLVEGRKAGPSLRRSWELVKGNRKKVFAVMVVMGVLQWLLSFGANGLSELFFSSASMRGSLMQTALVSALSIFLTPLIIVADILLYYDFRIRKEGFDLEMLSRALAATPETGAPPSLGR